MAGPLHVRPAYPDDADALADLETRARREADGAAAASPPEGAERWREQLADPGGTMTWAGVVRETGELVGVATAEATGPGEVRPLRLRMLHVLPQWRGQGLEQALLDHAVGDAPCYLWVAEDDTDAQQLYGRNGFTPDGARREDRAELRLVR